MRRRAATGLADADANSRKHQVPDIHGETGYGGHATPDCETDGDDPLAREDVREACDGDAQCRIEEAKGGAGQQTELRVSEMQILLDRLEENLASGVGARPSHPCLLTAHRLARPR